MLHVYLVSVAVRVVSRRDTEICFYCAVAFTVHVCLLMVIYLIIFPTLFPTHYPLNCAYYLHVPLYVCCTCVWVCVCVCNSSLCFSIYAIDRHLILSAQSMDFPALIHYLSLTLFLFTPLSSLFSSSSSSCFTLRYIRSPHMVDYLLHSLIFQLFPSLLLLTRSPSLSLSLSVP